jgi:glucose/arabinose dehydrogenase
MLVVAASIGLGGCLSDVGSGDPSAESSVSTPTETATETEPEGWKPAPGSPLDATVTAEVLVEGLAIPWDAAFADSGTIYLSERDGRILRVSGDGGDPTEVLTPEGVHTVANAGSLGLAFHPEEANLLYHYYTTKRGGERVNRVVRYDVGAAAPGETAEVIVGGIPGGVIHNGGAIAFGPDGDLWIPTGDGKTGKRAQQMDSLAGKVLRVTPEGEPAAESPRIDGADPRIYTAGHRNPQGLSWLPDGRAVLSEHGPTGRDEVNLLTPGGNYGWPAARDREAYAGTDFERPAVNTGADETWAPSGSIFYTGEAIPEWRNRFLAPGLRSQRLNIVTLTPTERSDLPPTDDAARRYDGEWLDDAYAATAHRTLEDDLGRIRRIVQGPDGGVFALTSNRDGRASGRFPRDRDDVLARLVSS